MTFHYSLKMIPKQNALLVSGPASLLSLCRPLFNMNHITYVQQAQIHAQLSDVLGAHGYQYYDICLLCVFLLLFTSYR